MQEHQCSEFNMKECPKIYLGMRTHGQIQQMLKELKKTVYSEVPMTILGSREQTCIHPIVSKSNNKNQDCQELNNPRSIEGESCEFRDGQDLPSHLNLRNYLGLFEAWDLEDLVKVGKEVKACPYYVTKELKNSAQLIICPYNYLIDPKIRESMKIDLKGQVVVLDEAHNIENCAREAASYNFDSKTVTDAMNDCEKMARQQV